MKATV